MRIARCWLAGWVALGAVTLAPARDAFVLLSGGGTPLTNNYSQYLQAKELSAHWERTYPANSVWVFFGIGNRPGQAAVLADVHKQVKEGDLLRDTWVAGALPRNRPARKAEFLKALREEILPTVHDGGTLYLFIGDHGSLARAEPKESVVTMWQLEPKGAGWTTNTAEELSVTDLRAALAAGLGRGRVVFCMTQCHSGGFHFLGAPRAVLPDTNWFLAAPDWAMPVDAKPLPLVAGFTAVDEESLAAGCDPDPDPDKWAGYERFVPEALLGVGLFDGHRNGPALPSYAAAHDAAVLVDQTIDKPRSTSEQFLERWAALIEKLALEKSLVPAVMKQVAAYQRAVDTGLAQATGVEFSAERARFGRYIERMGEQNQSARQLLDHGTRADLQQAVGSPPAAAAAAPGRPGAGAAQPPNERLKLWQEVVRPAWKAAVEAKDVKGLSSDARGFEQYLLAQEIDRKRDLMFVRGWQNPILNDLYWRSGYSDPTKLDPKRAEEVTRWGADRRQKIGEWARASADPQVKAAAEKLFPPRRNARAPAPASDRSLSTKIAAERALFYRRVLAAWSFLLTMDEQPALVQLAQLRALESTPLPAGSARP